MTLAKSHQWTALKTFVLNKPVLKKVVFETLELVSPRLYQVCFQDDHSKDFCQAYDVLVSAEVLYFCQHPLEVFDQVKWDGHRWK